MYACRLRCPILCLIDKSTHAAVSIYTVHTDRVRCVENNRREHPDFAHLFQPITSRINIFQGVVLYYSCSWKLNKNPRIYTTLVYDIYNFHITIFSRWTYLLAPQNAWFIGFLLPIRVCICVCCIYMKWEFNNWNCSLPKYIIYIWLGFYFIKSCMWIIIIQMRGNPIVYKWICVEGCCFVLL